MLPNICSMVGEKRKVAVTRVAASTRKVIAPDVISTCSSTQKQKVT